MEDNLLERVLSKSEEVIVKYGVKSITMDEISMELGISKKTLYNVIDSKNDLIEKTALRISKRLSDEVKGLTLQKLDPISELLEIDRIISDTIERIDPSVVKQFQKYYSDIYEKVADVEKETFTEIISNNLKKGINDGIYRSDLDVEFISTLHYQTSKSLINAFMFPGKEFDIRKVKHEYTIYHLRGIASYKGLSFIESKLRER